MPNEKDQNTTYKDILSFKGIESLSIKPRFTFCYKKSSKLLKVIYMFCGHEAFHDLHLKDEIVKTARLILKDTIDLLTGKKFLKYQFESNILYEISLLDAASGAGFISESNALILASEYQKLLALLEGVNEKEHNDLIKIDSNLIEKAINIGELQEKIPEPAIKRTLSVLNIRTSKTNIEKSHFPQVNSKPDFNRTKNNDRELIILSEVRRKRVVTIKDITAIMSNVSEKTVQRELLDMVAKGVLKKEGERRWSKYSIASV